MTTHLAYAVTDLGTLGGEDSRATDINDLGHVLGTSEVPGDSDNPFDQHSFLWEAGLFRDLGNMLGMGLNNQDQVAGTVYASGIDLFNPELVLSFRPILWEDGHSRDLLPPGATCGQAVAINDSEQVVGQTVTMPAGGETRSVEMRIFLWQAGQVSYLSVPPEYHAGVARSFNSLGQVVGYLQIASPSASPLDRCAALWDGQGVTCLDLHPSFCQTEAVAINNRGQILVRGDFPHTGASPSRQNPNAPRLTRAGLFWDAGLLTLISPETPGLIPRDLNDHGQVVGKILHKAAERCAFLWQHDQLTNLNTLIPTDSGWTLTDATAINNHGQIVGNGTHNGHFHACLLTP